MGKSRFCLFCKKHFKYVSDKNKHTPICRIIKQKGINALINNE